MGKYLYLAVYMYVSDDTKFAICNRDVCFYSEIPSLAEIREAEKTIQRLEGLDKPPVICNLIKIRKDD